MSAKMLVTQFAVLVLACGSVRAGVIFSDDFNTGSTPDPTKWTLVQDSGCSVYLSGGSMYASFKGEVAPRYAYASSPILDLSAGWEEIKLVGEWAFPTQGYGECFIMLVDPADTSVRVQATYVNWVGSSAQKAFRTYYTGHGEYVNRSSLPTTLTEFQLTVTPTGWSFTTEDGAISKTYATTHMAGLSQVQFKIGGYEYSKVSNLAQFDNIQFTPEPGTMALLAMGGLAMLRRGKRSPAAGRCR